MEALFDRLAQTPTMTKLMSVLIIGAMITAVNYFSFIQGLDEQIVGNLSSQASLDQQLIEKKEIADNLDSKMREKDVAEDRLKKALEELPAKRGLDELLKTFGDLAKKDGLELSVEPGVEVPDRFFARIPVRMRVSGNYHEIAMFLQDVAAMKRVVNVTNIKLGAPNSKAEKVILSGEFLATTFRFLDPSVATGDKPR